MSRKRSVMSERFKCELAKELGFYEDVKNGGWGNVRAKDAGNLVKRAIEIAERAMAESK